MDVYRIQTSLDVTGNVTRELRTILGSFEKIEGHAKGVKTHIDSWGGSIQRVLREVRSLSSAMAGLGRHSGSSNHSFALGFNATTVLADVKKIQEALNGVRTGNSGASRSFRSWATSLSNSAGAAERLDRALARVRQHAPGGSPVRVSGGGGGGGGGGGHRRGGWHHGHYYPHEARNAASMAGAVGVPTSAIHYGVEALKRSGQVNDQAVMQRVQGTSTAQMSQLPANIAANRALAFEYALKNGYTTPVDMMKGITDAADMGKGDFAEARLVAPSIARLSALANVVGDDEMHARVNDKGQNRALARALDQMGLTKDPERLQQYLPMIERGIVGTRAIFNGTELLNFVQHSGGEATNVSPEFVGGVLPMLTEALKGGPLGDSYNQMVKHLYKGTTTGWGETKTLLDMGFIKESDLIRNPMTGKVTKDFRVGAIEGSKELLGTQGKGDLFKFYTDVIKPKLEGPKGAQFGKTMEERTENFVESITKNKGYARMFKEFAVNEDQIKANIERFKNQGNPMDLLNKTMSGQLKQLTNSIETFTTVLGDAKVGQSVSALDALGKGIRGLAEDLYKNPDHANQAFGGVAAAAAGATTLGVIALAAAAFAVGGPIAVLVAGIVAVATYVAATDWEGLVKKIQGVKEGIGVGGKGPAGVTSNPGDLLAGVDSSANRPQTEVERRRAAGIQGLGVSAENTANAVRRMGETTGHTGQMAEQAAPLMERLGNALIDLARKAIMSSAVIGQINFGGGGGGGSGIQKANFTPGGGGLDGGLGGGSGKGGGNGIVPPGITGSDANMLGLISKYESGGRNVMNYIGDRTHTAQGYYQITNSNWRKIAPRLGIAAPNAMSASLADQARVAQVLLHGPGGAGNWTRYNPSLRRALQRGETYHAPKTSTVPPAPPPQRELVVHSHQYLDGSKVAMNVTRHQFGAGNRPATGANLADQSELYPTVG